MWDRFLLPPRAVEALITATLIWSAVVVVLDFGREIVETLIQAMEENNERKS